MVLGEVCTKREREREREREIFFGGGAGFNKSPLFLASMA